MFLRARAVLALCFAWSVMVFSHLLLLTIPTNFDALPDALGHLLTSARRDCCGAIPAAIKSPWCLSKRRGRKRTRSKELRTLHRHRLELARTTVCPDHAVTPSELHPACIAALRRLGCARPEVPGRSPEAQPQECEKAPGILHSGARPTCRLSPTTCARRARRHKRRARDGRASHSSAARIGA